MTQNEIADALGVTDRTVRNYLSERPRPRIKPNRSSKLDPFRGYVRTTIELNIRMNGELIYDSIRKMGYTGKRSVLKDISDSEGRHQLIVHINGVLMILAVSAVRKNDQEKIISIISA